MAKDINNKEVITGGDYKRMISGAYSEFLLEYDRINKMGGAGTLPGTQVLRTMGSAVVSIDDSTDLGIGAVSRRLATAAVFGARGSSGIVLAELLYGIACGLAGKYAATSSEFGRAFQIGILSAKNIIPSHEERPIIRLAKIVAKGAHKAVRANLPILDILEAAIEAGQSSIRSELALDAGAEILFAFLSGCRKGMDGNFVSPVMSLRLGLESRHEGLTDPRNDRVSPYCMHFFIRGGRLDTEALAAELEPITDMVLISKETRGAHIHIHTDRPGRVLEALIGWGPLKDLSVVNMSEPHALKARAPIKEIGLLVVAADDARAAQLEAAGADVLIHGSEKDAPAVAEVVSAVHSDFARDYLLIGREPQRILYEQARRLLGERVAIVICDDEAGEERALAAFDPACSLAENQKAMAAAIR